MINQVSRHQTDVQGQGQGDITLDSLSRSALISHKKEQSCSKINNIHSKLTKLYFEELYKASQGTTTDSILVGCEKKKLKTINVKK